MVRVDMLPARRIEHDRAIVAARERVAQLRAEYAAAEVNSGEFRGHSERFTGVCSVGSSRSWGDSERAHHSSVRGVS
jgi:hypothetical protein